jgi:hypothetical protein
MGMTVTIENLIIEKIKSKLNLGIACYCSVHNLWYSCFVSKNTKIKLYKINFAVVLYDCENWLLH